MGAAISQWELVILPPFRATAKHKLIRGAGRIRTSTDRPSEEGGVWNHMAVFTQITPAAKRLYGGAFIIISGLSQLQHLNTLKVRFLCSCVSNGNSGARRLNNGRSKTNQKTNKSTSIHRMMKTIFHMI